MFNPILASQEIKQSFIDYISTTFSFSNQKYQTSLRNALKGQGVIAKGPYLEISGSYESGRNIEELIEDGFASPLFKSLESVPEEKKEIKLLRPLYTHQEESIIKAKKGHNLVVTTGTGSGKTECFLLPIINSLLGEIEQGTLTRSVRAIIIYPMNALANDQMTRLRKILESYPEITFGIYTGNTKHQKNDALDEYRKLFNQDPLPNEILSRNEMQLEPPHVLITNYSMLEYMMLRPKDDAVFTGASLRYLILDEAHIYRGATGIETAMLMRRLRARISKPDSVQYILTSATLGGPESNHQITQFAQNLCSAPFSPENIIRSKTIDNIPLGDHSFPSELFQQLNQSSEPITEILQAFDADFAPTGNENEKIFELILRSDLYGKLRSIAKGPMTVNQIAYSMNISLNELVHFIATASRAVKGGVSLLKARYHFFIRALEGAYLSFSSDQQVYLTRILYDHKHYPVFECAVCEDCGRLSIVGQLVNDTLIHPRQAFEDESTEFFLVKEQGESSFFLDEEEADENSQETTDETDENDYVICPECGKLEVERTNRNHPLCDHGSPKIRLRKAKRRKNNKFACPACEFGNFRRFYLGYEAATAVIGTSLYEQLPEYELVRKQTPDSSENSFHFFRSPKVVENTQVRKARQFLTFSDSRADAAFFASYMEISFREFLRRRGLWHTCKELVSQGRPIVSVFELVQTLARLFEKNGSFVELGKEGESQTSTCMYQAYVSVINELVSSKRSSGLVQLGRLSFIYSPKEQDKQQYWNDAIKSVASLMNHSSHPERDAKALLNLIMLDAAYSGALESGEGHHLTGEEREYLFYSHYPRKLVKVTTDKSPSYVYGWSPQRRTGKSSSYYYSTRLKRVSRALNMDDEQASEFLDQFWEHVLHFENDKEYSLSITDFDVELFDDSASSEQNIYKCNRCGRITSHNCMDHCANIKCDGTLFRHNPIAEQNNNHYISLYESGNLKPFYIKEHTAQLSRDKAASYQKLFVDKRIHALSSSTTFEMGVDVGSLETVFLRNVPPTPANYVQRAGRAGRSLNSAAFALTYSKLSSHDFTYYNKPENMVSGKISAPLFELENEKIIRRHINAVALSAFLKEYPEYYDGDNRSNFLNSGGYTLLKEYLSDKPDYLQKLLVDSIPQSNIYGINDWSWIDFFTGQEGILETAVNDYNNTIRDLEKERERSRRAGNDEDAARIRRKLREYRADKEKDKLSNGRPPASRSLIDFLVRNNVLPKYGFPVDTVSLYPDAYAQNSNNNLQMQRDLQYAVAEYAPGSEIVADGRIYTSRYIKRSSNRSKGMWEYAYHTICQNKDCKAENYLDLVDGKDVIKCGSCGHEIARRLLKETIEPRKGFIAEEESHPVRMSKPDRNYRTDEFYIGDPSRRVIDKQRYSIHDQIIRVESTANDSLVVRTQTKFKVCRLCGFATGHNEKYQLEHKTAYGKKCSYDKPAKEYFLTHEFKTDVARITFETSQAIDYSTMISALFALLEAMSKELDIERNDIKGTLYKTRIQGIGLVYNIIIYDAVGGGAGHSRRLITSDGQVLSNVIKHAVDLLESCDCDPSCYKCLRNYFNQKLHDFLDRRIAASFLKKYIGPIQALEEEESEALISVNIKDKNPLKQDYESWDQASILLAQHPGLVDTFINLNIPVADFFDVTFQIDQARHSCLLLWETSKTMLVTNMDDEIKSQLAFDDWKVFSINDTDFHDLKKAISG